MMSAQCRAQTECVHLCGAVCPDFSVSLHLQVGSLKCVCRLVWLLFKVRQHKLFLQSYSNSVLHSVLAGGRLFLTVVFLQQLTSRCISEQDFSETLCMDVTDDAATH